MSSESLEVDVPVMLQKLGIDAEHLGGRWLARCPSGAHPDHRPSWDVVDEPGSEKHAYHVCRSCGFGGGAVGLVAHRFKLTHREARTWIEENCAGQEREAPTTYPVFARDHAFRLPPETIQSPIEHWPTPAREYLLGRGVTRQQVVKWRLGFAIHGRLAGRIILPVYGPMGEPQNYTARTFVDAPRRFLNPIEKEEHPVPGAIFGEQYWPEPALRELCVVCEGGMKCLAVERVASVPFGALFGSRVDVLHLAKLATFKRVLSLTDPDPAGDRAHEKLEQALGGRLRLGRVEIPKGPDVDEMPPAELRAHLEFAWRRLARHKGA